jgi:hypothetical protein
VLTKSDLLSWRQCPRRLWLEYHRQDLLPKFDPTNDRRIIDGAKVGERARADLGAGVLWPVKSNDQATAAAHARALLAHSPDQPVVEVPMVRDDLYVRADALVPVAGGYALRETKAATFPLKDDKVTPGEPKGHHLDDVAIQAWVMEGCGLSFARAELNLLNGRWRYPGDGDYAGLFRQLDTTPLIAERKGQVPTWLQASRATVEGPMPMAVTGSQCEDPYRCPFVEHCKGLEPPEPESPIELLPDSAGKKLVQRLKNTKGYVSILDPSPDQLTGDAADVYRRIQAAHRDGAAQIAPKIRGILLGLPYPRYYFDFEGIDLPVPRWRGVRPYEHVPFQWSCHIEHGQNQFTHKEFLDLTGNDPSLACIAAMRQAIDPLDGGPIIVYNETYERLRLKQLAERHPEHRRLLESYVTRIVDLLPLVKNNFYDPGMRGSFSIKKVLPVVARDLKYDDLGEAQDGTGAQVAYMRAIFENLSPERLREIDLGLRLYCRQDTWAMVEVAYFLAGQPRPSRPPEGHLRQN